MGVEIKETRVIVAPPSLTDSDVVVLPLSHLDNDPNLRVTFRYIRAYSPFSSDDDPIPLLFTKLATALSSALVPFHPLSASLRPHHNNSRLELISSPNSGVTLTLASAEGTTLAAANSDQTLLDSLAPSPADQPDALARPCTLQLTSFSCGAYALGAAIHHSLCDGLGASLFFNYLAALVRGDLEAARKVPVPVWGRDGLLPASGVVPPADSPVREFLGVGSGVPPPYSQEIGAVEIARFCVTDECVDAFKREMVDKSGLNFTTFEALGAFIWRAKVKASKIEGDKTVKFAYAVNIRRVVKPALPAGYWGNGCVPIYANSTAKDVAESPLWETAKTIKKSKRNVTDDYVRSFVDFQAAHHGEGISAGDEVSAFTDWRHLGHSTVDFGSGGPVDVLPLSIHFLGGKEPCYYLPGSGSDDPGFRLSVALRETAMPAFKAEMDGFCAGHFGL